MSDFFREFWDYYWPRRKFLIGVLVGMWIEMVVLLIMVAVIA